MGKVENPLITSTKMSLEVLRAEEENKLKGSLILDVDGENIYADMIKHFKRRSVSTSKIEITFKGEEAVGDGGRKQLEMG